MNYLYKAKIAIEDTNEILIEISSYSQEGLEEEMGKKKWTEAIERYENQLENDESKHGEQRMPEEYDEEVEIGGHIEEKNKFI